MPENPNTCWEITQYNPRNLRITMTTVTVGLESAIRMVPSFNGGTETDLASYITKCDHLLSIVATNIKPMIFEAILAQLSGDAFKAVRYREFTEWESLKRHLRTIFGSKHSINHLQITLSNMKQQFNEDVRSLAARIEQGYHELVGALTVKQNAGSAAAVAISTKTGALAAFVNGAQPAIRSLLRVRNVEFLEQAITVAIEEEQDLTHLK